MGQSLVLFPEAELLLPVSFGLPLSLLREMPTPALSTFTYFPGPLLPGRGWWLGPLGALTPASCGLSLCQSRRRQRAGCSRALAEAQAWRETLGVSPASVSVGDRPHCSPFAEEETKASKVRDPHKVIQLLPRSRVST